MLLIPDWWQAYMRMVSMQVHFVFQMDVSWKTGTVSAFVTKVISNMLKYRSHTLYLR